MPDFGDSREEINPTLGTVKNVNWVHKYVVKQYSSEHGSCAFKEKGVGAESW